MNGENTGKPDDSHNRMPAEPVTPGTPHHLPPMTDSELATYRRELEKAVTFFERMQAPVATLMRGRLAEILAEQAGRARPAAHA